MVKKKGKSKRTTLKDKYKIQRRVVETGRKRKKQAKRDAKAGIVKNSKRSKKDPGIPNSWPFKEELLKDIQRTRERQQQKKEEEKERRKAELRGMNMEDLMKKADQDRQTFEGKQASVQVQEAEKSEGAVAPGQASRRAYLRELKKVIDTADVLLQVLDARDPIGSRIHPSIENTILSRADKRMVLVLNKIDLVPKNIVGEWLTFLRKSQPTIAVKASNDHNKNVSNDGDEMSAVPVGMEGLLQLLKNYARTGGSGGKSQTTIVVGILGYPNTGKSSIINALKRCRAVGVSPRPGFTTSMQEVVLDRNVRLLDSPGVVFDDSSAMLGNCVDADSIDDPIPAVAALLERCNPASLVMTYNIPAFPPGDVMMFLAMVARSYGRVLKGGIPDKVAAARAVLRDWNNGKIPYYTPPPKVAPKVAPENAVIVTEFAKEFDVSTFDDTVMNALEDTDEMDFVELSELKPNNKEEVSTAVRYLSGQMQEDGMDEDSSEKEDDMDMEESRTAQSALADADDYDFDNM